MWGGKCGAWGQIMYIPLDLSLTAAGQTCPPAAGLGAPRAHGGLPLRTAQWGLVVETVGCKTTQPLVQPVPGLTARPEGMPVTLSNLWGKAAQAPFSPGDARRWLPPKPLRRVSLTWAVELYWVLPQGEHLKSIWEWQQTDSTLIAYRSCRIYG